MKEEPGLSRKLVAPGIVLLVGVVALAVALLGADKTPVWLTRTAALLTIGGAAWELLTVHVHERGRKGGLPR